MTNDERNAPTIPAPPPVVRCECRDPACGEYALDEWMKLPLVGYQADGNGGWLELRNVRCGSTRAILLLEEPEAA